MKTENRIEVVFEESPSIEIEPITCRPRPLPQKRWSLAILQRLLG